MVSCSIYRQLDSITFAKLNSHEEIRDTFNITARDPSERIYQCMNQLKLLLGKTLLRLVLRKGKNQQYLIQKTGWSFCWIRQDNDPLQSALLDGIR